MSTRQAASASQDTAENAKKRYLRSANDWFRKQGTPMIIPTLQRALDAVPRSIPWVLWVSILHLCVVALRGNLIALANDSEITIQQIQRGALFSLPEEATALGLIVIVLFAGIIPPVSLLIIGVGHLVMMRLKTWAQYICGAITLMIAGSIFSIGFTESAPSLEEADFTYNGLGVFPLLVALIFLTIWVGGDTILGWSLKHVFYQLQSLPPMIAKVLPVLMISVLFIFVNADVWKLANVLSFSGTWQICGAMILLAFFVMVTTSYERTKRLLGTRRGDDVEEFTDEEYDAAAQESGPLWRRLRTWEAEHDITVHRSLTVGQWLNLLAIPILGQLIQTVFFVLLVFGFFSWFASVAVTDQTIELWVGTKPEHLKILGLEFNYNAVVLKVTMIVAVFSGLSFAATTSSDDRHARDFLEPMVLRLRKILMIRDIYLSIFRMSAEETLEGYELWSASAQEDSTESVDSTDKETVKDNGLEEATESGSTDS
ncbi:D-mannonate dehydratase [Rothia dentocariosa]|uniref:D-mannonate dehydratase n=1 Tax=Rothia dentocariosa TaxID=2047 RepID=UPI0028E795B5|nr:D-mannonate dehydratase [Rothia dentocariosa]